MAKTLITFPGKIGDALAQWPAAYRWHVETGERFDVMLDAGIAHLAPLLKEQSCVEEVVVEKRVEHWHQGGQPFHMNLTDAEKERWPTAYHLGLRGLPRKMLAMEAAEHIPLQDKSEATLAKQSLFVGERETEKMLVVHATTRTHYDTNIRPRVWDLLGVCGRYLRMWFHPIILVGNDDDWAMARKYRWDGMQFLNNDLLATAKLMNNASFVVGSGSMGVVMAACLGIPSLRVHDPILGNEDFTLWSNPGTMHANYYPEGAILIEEVCQFVEAQCLSPLVKT